jgi:Holliday junction resolvasome RuvABC endonuclease subunit
VSVLGIDPSVTSTGFAYEDMAGNVHTGRIRPGKLKGVERLQFIAEALNSLLQRVWAETGEPVTLVAYEDYAMGKGGKSNPGRVFTIGEAGGVLKLTLHREHVDILLVSPGSLKKFITGKGNTEKELVPSFIAKEWGYNIQQNDEADAYGLLRMAQAYTATRPPRKAYRREALGSCSLLSGAIATDCRLQKKR